MRNMAESAAQNRMSMRLSAAVSRGLRESSAIALAGLALVVLVALLSFNPHDPGFSFTGEGGPVHNRIGPVGAWFADALYFLFGRPAYLLPAILAASAWQVTRAHSSGAPGSHLNLALRAAGFVTLLVASCALAALHWSPGTLPQGAGGVVGSAAGGALAAGLQLLGATLLLLAAWLAGAAVAFGVSWFAVMDRIGHWTWTGVNWIRERFFTAREVNQARSARLERKEALQAEQKRAPPRVAPESKRRHRRPSRVSGRKRNAKYRCSIRRSQRSCHRSICSTILAGRSHRIRPRRSRPCRAWSSSSSRTSVSRWRWWRCIRARWSPASKCDRRRE